MTDYELQQPYQSGVLDEMTEDETNQAIERMILDAQEEDGLFEKEPPSWFPCMNELPPFDDNGDDTGEIELRGKGL
jgi:hypothetical protein